MIKIKDLEWFCPQPFMNTLLYRTVAPQSCCVLNMKTKIKLKYGTTDPKELHNKEEYVNFRNEFLNGGGPLTQKNTVKFVSNRKNTQLEVIERYI